MPRTWSASPSTPARPSGSPGSRHRRPAAAWLRQRAGLTGPLGAAHPLRSACASGGEEIFVLDGAVEDEEGRYAAGSWLRNPPGSQHTPFSLEGCLLDVKIGHLP